MYALLMRLLADPTLTHRSRGNDRTAACRVMGSRRMIMIESLRLPIESRAGSAALAHGESGATHGSESEPTIRKLAAFGSAGGKSSAIGTVSPGCVLSLPAIVVAGSDADVSISTFSTACVLSSSCLP